jgi:hypothetical protein
MCIRISAGRERARPPKSLGCNEGELGIEDDPRRRKLGMQDPLLAAVLVRVSANASALRCAQRRRHCNKPDKPALAAGTLAKEVRHDLASVDRAPAADRDEDVSARSNEGVNAFVYARDWRMLANTRKRAGVSAVRSENRAYSRDHIRLCADTSQIMRG